jgi:Zn-dependent M28 family amino/carboxypeptidase
MARLLVIFVTTVLLAAIVIGWGMMFRMPGKSHRGPLPPMSEQEKILAVELRRDVETLALQIGERNIWNPAEMRRAADYLESELEKAGWTVTRHAYRHQGETWHNIEAEIRGSEDPDEIVLVGAHYDSVITSPGANDNGSGCAALLAIARHFAGSPQERTLRLVFFANEEPPTFLGEGMGSYVYARRSRERGEQIVAMLSLETIGYYSDEKGSQQYPFPLAAVYPSTGDFIAFVGNLGSRALLKTAIGSFRRHASFPSEGGALPAGIPGVGWSDHWSFWQFDYPAIMITDTALFRDPSYHTPHDLPHNIDYERLARVVAGLQHVVEDLTTRGSS